MSDLLRSATRALPRTATVALVAALLSLGAATPLSSTAAVGHPCDGVTVGALTSGTLPDAGVDACMTELLTAHEARLGPDVPCIEGAVVAHVGIPERWQAAFAAITDAYTDRCS